MWWTLFLLAALDNTAVAVVTADEGECVYGGVWYAAGSVVPVSEPCLRCACAAGALRCALRVCPALPDPPPPGCVLRQRLRHCCAELRCNDDSINTNRIEARVEPDLPEIPFNQSTIGKGCIQDGSVYASGSAMHVSGRCRLCYCLAGQARCVRPTCAPAAPPSCRPRFAPHSCCPTSYDCRPNKDATLKQGSCLVSGVRHAEGALIPLPGASACTRCYCVQGRVRCSRLHCAPPLHGCEPIVPPQHCCPSSYNCSGIIEVRPVVGYEPALVSSQYSQLRRASPASQSQPIPTTTPTEAQPIRTRLAAPTTPYYFTTQRMTSRHYVHTTNTLSDPVPQNLQPESSAKYSRISVSNSLGSRQLDATEVLDTTTETATTETTTDGSTFPTDTTTPLDSTIETNPTEPVQRATEPIIVKLIGNNSECIDGPINEIIIEDRNIETTTEELETTTVDTTIMISTDTSAAETTSEINITTTPIPPFKSIPTASSVNKKDEDYDYDYNLQPNLEIIPFVAADAVVDGTVTESSATAAAYPYGPQLFSPPHETEGGFVPRDPPPFDLFSERMDVIRTEPAPDLAWPIHQQAIPSDEEIKREEADDLLTAPQPNYIYTTTNKPWGGGGGGVVKLAGCNIYGRMYRVGKIITELSGPCLQCRCADSGVACHPLPC